MELGGSVGAWFRLRAKDKVLIAIIDTNISFSFIVPPVNFYKEIRLIYIQGLLSRDLLFVNRISYYCFEESSSKNIFRFIELSLIPSFFRIFDLCSFTVVGAT